MIEKNIINGQNIALMIAAVGLASIASFVALFMGVASLSEPCWAYVFFVISAITSLAPGYYLSRGFYGLTAVALGMAGYTLYLGAYSCWAAASLVLLVSYLVVFLVCRSIKPKEG